MPMHLLKIHDKYGEAKNIGLMGKGGLRKNLLLNTLFNNKNWVRNHFKEGLLLWPTVSQAPSVTSLINELCTQIAIQKNVNEEDVKMWLNQTLQQSRRIVLFLDYVWGGNAGNLESLTQIKALSVQNNGETMNERTLGSMTKMDTL